MTYNAVVRIFDGIKSMQCNVFNWNQISPKLSGQFSPIGIFFCKCKIYFLFNLTFDFLGMRPGRNDTRTDKEKGTKWS